MRRLLLLVIAACTSTDDLRVTIDTGALHGAKTGSIRHFLGIPYAAPPIGANRFRVPQPAAPWTGTRDALQTGSECPQSFLGSADDEDCLFVNVWSPSGAHDLPVMVWVHGGAFVSGSGGDKWYDGSLLAARGVVVVSLNYRLGAFGFLAHAALDADDPTYPTSGNYGLEDQRAALEWVQRNAAAFGGDPREVTLFGESAGGFSVCVQYLSSRTQGLFGAAIVESGLCGADLVAPTHATAIAQGATLAQQLGCAGNDATTTACLRGIGTDAILSATMLPPLAGQQVGGPFYQSTVLAAQLPNVDGVVLATSMRTAFAQGGFTARPLLAGNNKDEGTLFHSTVYALQPQDETEYRAALAVRFGTANVDAIVAQYPVASYPSPNDALAAITTDSFFVCPTRQLVRAVAKAGAPVFRYSFEHPLENPFQAGLGVFHSSELPFVFGNDDFPLGEIGTSGAPIVPQMQAYWTQLAVTHDPNRDAAPPWPSYDGATDPYLVLDVQITQAAGLKTALCDFWDALPAS